MNQPSHDGQQPAGNFCNRTRREFLWEAGAGFTGLALTGMLSGDGFFSKAAQAASLVQGRQANPLAPKPPQFAPKAKSVIFLFMYGGPSHMDTFDYKPKLYALDGKTITIKTFGRGGKKNEGRVVGPKWKFHQYGECGKWVSTLFPNLATCVDDIAFLHSMTADSPIHGSAMLQMNTGKILSGSPCLGSWVNYGLGSVNEDLPGFVVMLDPTGGPISGAKNWSSGYMPASYQGTILRSAGVPVLDLNRGEGVSESRQRHLLDTLHAYNNDHLGPRVDNTNLSARIASYEMAYSMQRHAPEAVNLASETKETQELYGLNDKKTEDFGRRCLLARRLVERGVRFVQLYAGGAHNDSNWDAHGDLEDNHNYHAGRTDKPIAALLKDLKRRGMLDETLVIWGGEFGRQPTAEYAMGTGRDHNAYGFTMWMAGGGIKGGVSVGETDELGGEAISDRLHVKNLHATVLNQLGVDPNRLSYFYNGLDQKLVGVEGAEPIASII
ncbi:DUF1501 domain-containing protein [Singulisphaera sp. PoT]|uniref:DUF1501 domain-containing protein n=1 Tax=Singulisphaera sp. PoT TaxID=3411797 RepID=UPI003BF5C010